MTKPKPPRPAQARAGKPKAGAAKPVQAGAAQTQQVSLTQVLQQAGRLASADKMPEAIAFLEKFAGKFARTDGQPPLQLVDLLVQGVTRMRMHNPAGAVKLAKEATQRDPELTVAWVMLSGLLDRLGDTDGAKEACLKVVGSKTATPEQIIAASNLLVRYREDKIANDSAKKAFDALGRPLEWASAVLYIAQRVADWPFVKELTDQLLEGHKAGKTRESRESPRTNLLWCGDEAINVEVLKQWSDQALAGEVAPRPEPTPIEGRRVRVGYLSSDFRDHPTSRLINGLLRHHDRNKFEVFLYCSGWDDGSAMRREVESNVDHVHTVSSLGDAAAARLIRSHGIDVLVELNGPTRANRMGILRWGAAPVQIDYLGWPGTVGGRVVDYVVGDGYCVPPGVEKLYPEKVIRLHQTYQVNDYAAREVPPVPSRAKVGLPEGVKVIGMFNAINKVNGEVWSVWMKILKAVPDSVLWVLDPGPVSRRNMGKACLAEGIEVRRVLAAPPVLQDAHLARLQCCDLMVDPWPYGGHTSTSDALFAGVPVVALAGTNFASRVSGGLLKAAGLEALVQPDVEGYIKMAVKLLRKPEELARLKAFIRESTPKADIFDARKRTRQLEAAYMSALQRRMEGKPPAHISFVGKGAQAGAKAAPAPVTAIRPRETAPATNDPGRLPLVLVCGPWSSGTSAVAGMLASAGLRAPGPYVAVNDPRTPATYEMKAFQGVLRGLASEETLQRTATPAAIVQALREFRDTVLKDALKNGGDGTDRPLMLKHALTALMLPEICEVFDTRIVCVVRPLADIEATRVRRKWPKSFGAAGAARVYQNLFDHLINRQTPFTLVRYSDVLNNSGHVVSELLRFCGVEADEKARAAALAFVSRPPPAPAVAARA